MSISGASMVGEVPSWFLYVHAVTYLVYRMLDEMDGKQARRTENSSPLGLLFDHGCDCFTIGLQNIMLSKELCVGENPIAMVSLIASYMVFHFTTLEEYYLGTLKLPMFNGVSDGSLILIILMIFTGAIGNTWWAEDACDGKWLSIPSVTNLNRGQLFSMCATLIVTGSTIIR
jgi:ethanolaminephosphotransferase